MDQDLQNGNIKTFPLHVLKFFFTPPSYYIGVWWKFNTCNGQKQSERILILLADSLLKICCSTHIKIIQQIIYLVPNMIILTQPTCTKYKIFHSQSSLPQFAKVPVQK